MSGQGIKDKFLLFRPSRQGISRWRRESFLEQLSAHGSMLWVPNHDLYWVAICSEEAGRAFSGWTGLRRDLAERPARETRKILYQSSERFFQQSERAWSEAAKVRLQAAGELGHYLQSWRRDLDRRSQQLAELRWCLEDQETGRIEIIEK